MNHLFKQLYQSLTTAHPYPRPNSYPMQFVFNWSRKSKYDVLIFDKRMFAYISSKGHIVVLCNIEAMKSLVVN